MENRNGPEFSQQNAIISRLKAANLNLLECGIPEVSMVTHYVTFNRKLTMYFTNYPDIPPLDFQLMNDSAGETLANQSLKPVTIINVPKLLQAPPASIEADMVRIMSLHFQTPANGYERRFRDSMKEAVDLERLYLEKQNKPFIEHDPRSEGQEENIQHFLTGPRYCTDVGFEDFIRVVDFNLKVIGYPRDLVEIYDPLVQNPLPFVIIRNNILEDIGDFFSGDENYYTYTPDERAYKAAQIIFSVIDMQKDRIPEIYTQAAQSRILN